MNLRFWPHPDLKKVCPPVDIAKDLEFKSQLEEMKFVAQRAGGIGLAANQVGILKAMLIAFKPGEGFVSFVNPRVVGFQGEWRKLREGCLSIPGYFEEIPRAEVVVVESVDIKTGATFASPYEGILGHVLQHEIEHLNGKMFIDRLPGGKKDQIRAYMKRIQAR